MPQIPVTWIIIGLVAVLLTSLVLGVVHWTFERRADTLRAEIDDVDRSIAALGVEIKRVEEFKVRKEDLERKLSVIQQLKVAQKGPVRLLDQLASAVPPRVWIKEVAENGAAVSIAGQALDHTQIATFMENLEKSPFFANVELSGSQATTQRQQDENVVKDFKITSTITYPKDL
ncbi:PilN domain-containing protein [bacterium]|nr:PilN domain-containing protein [bacterium]